MSEEVKPQEVPAPKPKQFLLMADELSMALLSKLIPSLQFCQVEGMVIPDNPNYQVLANPIPKPPVE
jgi:hypothetical protein